MENCPWKLATYRTSYRRYLLERSTGARHPPAFCQKLIDRGLLNPFLHSQFVIHKMIRKRPRRAVDMVDTDPVAVAIGTDQADSQVRLGDSSNGRVGFGLGWHLTTR
jgi:hypothetical protein